MAGHLLLDRAAGSFEGGIARITIEDSGRADLAARMISELTIRDIAHVEGRAERITFVLDCPAPPAGKCWAVRAWLDQPGRGQFTTDRIQVDAQQQAVALPLHHGAGS